MSKSKNTNEQTNWSRGGREWSDLPKKNPGPGKYNHDNKLQPRFEYELPGHKFS